MFKAGGQTKNGSSASAQLRSGSANSKLHKPDASSRALIRTKGLTGFARNNARLHLLPSAVSKLSHSGPSRPLLIAHCLLPAASSRARPLSSLSNGLRFRNGPTRFDRSNGQHPRQDNQNAFSHSLPSGGRPSGASRRLGGGSELSLSNLNNGPFPRDLSNSGRSVRRHQSRQSASCLRQGEKYQGNSRSASSQA